MVSSTARSVTALWPPDDTEESIVGVDRHQFDIISVRIGINEEASRMAGGGSLPWQAISQLMYLGCERPDGSPYTVYPDVFVFPRPMDRTRGSYSLTQDGPPVLVVEVASESTYRNDLDSEQGKGWSYAHAGVAEYLVLDPTGVFVPERGRGLRLADGVYRAWQPEPDGRWRSEQIGVSLGVEDDLAAVYGSDGRRKLREGEIDLALEARRMESIVEGEAIGRAQGIMEGELLGRLESKRAALRRVVQVRFGSVPANLEARIAAADDATLDTLFDRALGAPGVDAL